MDIEDYDEAIENASEILVEAMLEDIDELIEEGRRLDLKVKMVVFAVGRRMLCRLYEIAKAVLVNEYKREGMTVERREKVTFKPLFGPIEVESPYMYDREQKKGARPMRESFGIVGGSYSDGADRAISDLGAESSFREAAERFEEHYNWKPGETTIRKRTEDVAEAAEAFVDQRLEETSEVFGAPPMERQLEAEHILVQADGCHIRCGEWLSAEEARQRTDDEEQLARLADCADDEKVRLIEWKEVRTGLVRRFDEKEATYICNRANWGEIAEQLFEAACGHGLSFETETIAIGDGAYGLKDGIEMKFAEVQFILDWFHLKHHFHETAERLLAEGHLVGDGSEWVEGHLDRIYEGQAGETIADLESLKSSIGPPPGDHQDHEEAPKTAYGRVEQLIEYLTRFYECLDYEEYKEKGWPIGSGEVESAHKSIPQDRLKLPGATWDEENLSKMCALRVLQANGWWEDFWDHEHERRQAA